MSIRQPEVYARAVSIVASWCPKWPADRYERLHAALKPHLDDVDLSTAERDYADPLARKCY